MGLAQAGIAVNEQGIIVFSRLPRPGQGRGMGKFGGIAEADVVCRTRHLSARSTGVQSANQVLMAVDVVRGRRMSKMLSQISVSEFMVHNPFLTDLL